MLRTSAICTSHAQRNFRIPKNDQERKFWAAADSTDYLDWPSTKRTKPVRLKPTLKTISLRLPLSMIQDLKILANRRDLP